MPQRYADHGARLLRYAALQIDAETTITIRADRPYARYALIERLATPLC